MNPAHASSPGARQTGGGVDAAPADCSWIATLRTQHRDPDALNLAVARVLFAANHKSKGSHAQFAHLSVDQRLEWVRRAQRLVARERAA
jgi:hypothetical protein